MSDDALTAAWALVDRLQRGEFDAAEDAAIAALGRTRKARFDVVTCDSSDGRDVRTDGGQCVVVCPECGGRVNHKDPGDEIYCQIADDWVIAEEGEPCR